MREKSVVCITLNPAIDRVIEVENFTVGHDNVASSSIERLGGRGINMAEVIRQFDVPVVATGLMGEKSVPEFKRYLEARDIGYGFATVPGDIRLHVKIIDKTNNIPTRIKFPSFACTQADVDLVLAMVSSYQEHIFILAGSLPNTLANSTYAYMVKELKKLGAKVVVDATGDTLKHALQERPWFFKPNQKELEALVGKKLSGIDDIEKYGRKLQEKYVDNIAISLEKQGAVFISNNHSYYCKPPPLELISDIGAGDSLVGAWVACKILGKTAQEAALFATATASASITHFGVGMQDQKALHAIIEECELLEI